MSEPLYTAKDFPGIPKYGKTGTAMTAHAKLHEGETLDLPKGTSVEARPCGPGRMYPPDYIVVTERPKTGLAWLWAKLTGGELTVSETWVAK